MTGEIPPGLCFELTDCFRVGASLERAWEFFSSAENLPRITPPWLHFRIRTPSPIVIQKDAILDYTIRWMKLPVRWRTRIVYWEPPTRFVDLQERGPYRLWWHEHTFEPDGAGVKCSDRVLYRLPLGPVGRVGHAMLVRRQLREIFEYRRRAIAECLGEVALLQPDIGFALVSGR